MRANLDIEKVKELLDADMSQQQIADYYTANGLKCSRSKVQSFIRENKLSRKSLGNAIQSAEATSEKLQAGVYPQKLVAPIPSIDPSTALWYEKRENEKLISELTEAKRKIDEQRDKIDNLKEENRTLKEDARLAENKKPNALNGLVEQASSQLPELITALGSAYASIKAAGNNQPEALPSPANLSPNAQTIINHATGILANNADDFAKLEKLVVLLESAAKPESEGWLNATIDLIKKQQA